LLCFYRCHPELNQLRERLDLLAAASKKLAQALRSKLSETVLSFGRHFKEEYAATRSDLIEKDKANDLSSPISIIDAVDRAVLDISKLLQTTEEQRSKYVSEESATDVIVRHSTLLGRLVYIRPETIRDKKKSDPWDAREATKRLRYILDSFRDVMELEMFKLTNAQELTNERKNVDEEYKLLCSRLEKELPALSRLHMSTIGSSHRIITTKQETSDDDLASTFGQMSLKGTDDDIVSSPPKPTVCIFDESGCIPAYELLGLSRLGRPIIALILVGDKHQLPPYDPTQGRTFGRGNAPSNVRSTKVERLKSLLDVSTLTIDSGKIMLTMQYRVPRDIAEMLNIRIYRGNYKTSPTARVPMSGMMH
jgi:hypothetical protein